jgi:hypothetical protein
VRAVAYLATLRPVAGAAALEMAALHVLNNFDIPFGLIRASDSPEGDDHILWSTISNLTDPVRDSRLRQPVAPGHRPRVDRLHVGRGASGALNLRWLLGTGRLTWPQELVHRGLKLHQVRPLGSPQSLCEGFARLLAARPLRRSKVCEGRVRRWGRCPSCSHPFELAQSDRRSTQTRRESSSRTQPASVSWTRR